MPDDQQQPDSSPDEAEPKKPTGEQIKGEPPTPPELTDMQRRSLQEVARRTRGRQRNPRSDN